MAPNAKQLLKAVSLEQFRKSSANYETALAVFGGNARKLALFLGKIPETENLAFLGELFSTEEFKKFISASQPGNAGRFVGITGAKNSLDFFRNAEHINAGYSLSLAPVEVTGHFIKRVGGIEAAKFAKNCGDGKSAVSFIINVRSKNAGEFIGRAGAETAGEFVKKVGIKIAVEFVETAEGGPAANFIKRAGIATAKMFGEQIKGKNAGGFVRVAGSAAADEFLGITGLKKAGEFVLYSGFDLAGDFVKNAGGKQAGEFVKDAWLQYSDSFLRDARSERAGKFTRKAGGNNAWKFVRLTGGHRGASFIINGGNLKTAKLVKLLGNETAAIFVSAAGGINAGLFVANTAQPSNIRDFIRSAGVKTAGEFVHDASFSLVARIVNSIGYNKAGDFVRIAGSKAASVFVNQCERRLIGNFIGQLGSETAGKFIKRADSIQTADFVNAVEANNAANFVRETGIESAAEFISRGSLTSSVYSDLFWHDNGKTAGKFVKYAGGEKAWEFLSQPLSQNSKEFIINAGGKAAGEFVSRAGADTAAFFIKETDKTAVRFKKTGASMAAKFVMEAGAEKAGEFTARLGGGNTAEFVRGLFRGTASIEGMPFFESLVKRGFSARIFFELLNEYKGHPTVRRYLELTKKANETNLSPAEKTSLNNAFSRFEKVLAVVGRHKLNWEKHPRISGLLALRADELLEAENKSLIYRSSPVIQGPLRSPPKDPLGGAGFSLPLKKNVELKLSKGHSALVKRELDKLSRYSKRRYSRVFLRDMQSLGVLPKKIPEKSSPDFVAKCIRKARKKNPSLVKSVALAGLPFITNLRFDVPPEKPAGLHALEQFYGERINEFFSQHKLGGNPFGKELKWISDLQKRYRIKGKKTENIPFRLSSGKTFADYNVGLTGEICLRLRDYGQAVTDKGFHVFQIINSKTGANEGNIIGFERKINGKKFLVLQGVNPKQRLVSTSASPAKLYSRLMSSLRNIAKQQGFSGILSSAEEWHLSNREDIIKLMERHKHMQLKKPVTLISGEHKELKKIWMRRK